MDLFRDRRPSGHLPKPEDFSTPLSRTALTKANNRFRQSGVQRAAGNDSVQAETIVRRLTKERFNARHKGAEDFPDVGSYLQYLNDQVS